jgi:hypothetical protein
MVWGLMIVMVLALLVGFTTHSPGLMGLCLAVALLSGIAAALVFIDRHVRASSRPEHMTERELEALRSTLRKPADTQQQLPPSQTP